MSLNKHTLIIFAVVVLLVTAVGADLFNFKKNGGHDDSTKIVTDGAERAQQVAQSWIEDSSSTYVFDGMNLESVESGVGDCKRCFVSTFSFESRHGGYGDREGLFVTQVITPHTIEIEVDDGKVTRAIIDGKYNELTGALAE